MTSDGVKSLFGNAKKIFIDFISLTKCQNHWLNEILSGDLVVLITVGKPVEKILHKCWKNCTTILKVYRTSCHSIIAQFSLDKRILKQGLSKKFGPKF